MIDNLILDIVKERNRNCWQYHYKLDPVTFKVTNTTGVKAFTLFQDIEDRGTILRTRIENFYILTIFQYQTVGADPGAFTVVRAKLQGVEDYETIYTRKKSFKEAFKQHNDFVKEVCDPVDLLAIHLTSSVKSERTWAEQYTKKIKVD